MDVRIIDLIREMKNLIEEHGKMLNEVDNRLSSDIKRLEEKIMLLENRIENYRFMLEKRYIPALLERIEGDEKRMKKMEDSISSLRIQWSEFRDRMDERLREIQASLQSQMDFEMVMRKIKGLEEKK